MKKILLIICLSIILSVSQAGAGTFQYRGINVCSWWIDSFKYPEVVDPALDSVASIGANLVQINWRVMFDDVTGVYSPDWREETLANIAVVIDKAQERGMNVSLMPHLSSKADGGNMNVWTTNEATLNKAQLFNDYNNYMAQVADLAQQRGVAFLVIGVENNIIDTGDRGHWENIIKMIRSRYSGPLTYSALAAPWGKDDIYGRDFQEVVFWDLLDFVSVSVYPPLTENNNASYEELVQSWCTARFNSNWIEYLTSIHLQTGKRVYFSEMGFPSVDGGASLPYTFDLKGLQDVEEQRLATQSAFDVWDDYADRENRWLMGISMWEVCVGLWWDKTVPWYVNGHEPFGKPVENTIRHWFKVIPIQNFINKYHVMRHGGHIDPVGMNNWTHALWSGTVSGLDYIMALWGTPEQAQTGEFYFLCDDIGIRAN